MASRRVLIVPRSIATERANPTGKYRIRAGSTRFKGGIGLSTSASSIVVTGAVMRYCLTAVPLSTAIMPIRQTTVALKLISFSNKWAVSACRRCTKLQIFSPGETAPSQPQLTINLAYDAGGGICAIGINAQEPETSLQIAGRGGNCDNGSGVFREPHF